MRWKKKSPVKFDKIGGKSGGKIGGEILNGGGKF